VNALRKFFLRGQAWQVFLVVAGGFAIGEVAFIGSLMATPNDPFGTTNQRLPLDIVAAICSSIGFLWLWFLGTSLNEIARPNLKQNVRGFALALVVSEVYLATLFISAQNPRVLNAIAPVALVATVSIFYAVRFVARALLLAETGKEPKAYEYVVPFLLLCFFPLGIWALQPRINQLGGEKGEGD
jgi:hypothetical protein